MNDVESYNDIIEENEDYFSTEFIGYEEEVQKLLGMVNQLQV